MPPPESVRISVCRPRRYFFGSWARASRAVSMWSAAVAARVPGPQQPGDRLSGPVPAVVDETHQRVMAEGLLPRRHRVLLVGVRDHQHSVQVYDHLPGRVRRRVTGHLPDVLADLGTG